MWKSRCTSRSSLVVLVIFIFLGRATDTLIPAVALPLSLLMTFIVMNILGYSLDNLSLMALTLAIGFLVDDAIVFLENTVRLMESGRDAVQAALNRRREISFTILAMTISLAAVFLPLVFMSGLMGRIFREFSVTIIVAIFASGLVSLTLTPLMCARLLAKRGKDVKKNWIERIDRRSREARARSIRPIALVLPPSPVDFGADLGRLPARHDTCSSRSFPKRSCRSATARFSWACLSRRKELRPPDARITRSRPRRRCTPMTRWT